MTVMPYRAFGPSVKAGFTLIEMSIVLVVIGLVVGGILVGRDVISSAAVRAQVSQIEKYNQAVNTFRDKYGYLPGDINATAAAQFGFLQRGIGGVYAGNGDGNGLIEGVHIALNCGYCVGDGEPVMFWNDLTYANGMNLNLIEGSFSAPGGSWSPSGNGNPSAPGISGATLASWFPPAKIGGGNYVYVYSQNSVNYYGLSVVTNITYYDVTSSVGLTVKQAYDIDKKVDDGLPQSGVVIATYINATYPSGPFLASWAAGGGGQGTNSSGSPSTTATPGTVTACYDNGNSSSGAAQQYSLEINSGSYVNCALSFKMQAGD